ncbi:group III truncated hemoglobin [Microvirga splendida]|uniref:Group III truncated hemoglobin n=1 Tax=Microvirga splendida TaxID=2795727 RepID=A0ABS0Y0U5_9HYPH|nr:group III truncated hemoglobin [Microvirga splendida]MBJ6125570.1 group III truncated hemoglobin [Microvirga splendida]
MNSTTAISLIEPARGVTEDLIRRLVETFYGRVLQDEELGPIFRRALSHRWSEHLAIMIDFWSSVALRTGRYQGKPQAAHRGMALMEGHFERWLALFEAAAREVCEPDVAEFLIDRARRIADSLQIGLNIGPKALHLPSRAAGDGVRGRG